MRTFIVFWLALFSFAKLWGQVAIFPFEDLSMGLNGVDFEVAERMAEELEKYGYSVVGPRRVVEVLSKYHVMWTGWVDRITADRISRELGTQYILLGTVLERNKRRFSFGLSLRMLDAVNYKVIWANSVFFSANDRNTFLGLGSVGWDTFLRRSVSKVVSSIPPDVFVVMSRKPMFGVSKAFIDPKYAMPGDLVWCRVKVEVSGADPNRVYFVVDGVGKLVARKEGKLWVASWRAPFEDGRYGVSLVAEWGPPFNMRKKILVSSYYVDGTPPSFKMILRDVKKMGDSNIFIAKEKVEIFPMVDREDIERWKFEVISVNGDNSTVFSYDGSGAPPVLVWRGQTFKGKLKNGFYLLRLTLWDRAGNSSFKERRLLLVKDVFGIKIEVFKEDSGLRFRLVRGDFPIPVSGYRLIVWSEDGEVFIEREHKGEGDIIVPINVDKDRKLFYKVEIRDKYGDRWFMAKRPLVSVKASGGTSGKDRGNGWFEDF